MACQRAAPALALITLIFGVTLLTGCGSIPYQQYVGDQQDWPVANPARRAAVPGIPIYHGPPDQPYIILGQANLQGDPIHDLQDLVKQKNGDAGVLLEEERIYAGEYRAPTQSFTSYNQLTDRSTTIHTGGWTSARYRRAATGLVIQFKKEPQDPQHPPQQTPASNSHSTNAH